MSFTKYERFSLTFFEILYIDEEKLNDEDKSIVEDALNILERHLKNKSFDAITKKELELIGKAQDLI